MRYPLCIITQDSCSSKALLACSSQHNHIFSDFLVSINIDTHCDPNTDLNLGPIAKFLFLVVLDSSTWCNFHIFNFMLESIRTPFFWELQKYTSFKHHWAAYELKSSWVFLAILLRILLLGKQPSSLLDWDLWPSSWARESAALKQKGSKMEVENCWDFLHNRNTRCAYGISTAVE